MCTVLESAQQRLFDQLQSTLYSVCSYFDMLKPRQQCYDLQGSLHALRDDIDNRVEYALWQQRQAHEASLQQLSQQHAQELQLAVSC